MCSEMVLIRESIQDDFLTTPLGRVGIPQGFIWSGTMNMYEEKTENAKREGGSLALISGYVPMMRRQRGGEEIL